MSTPPPIPPGMHTLTPHLVCADAEKAMTFYQNAFGAEELGKLKGPDGKLMHGVMRIGDSFFMLVDEYPEWGSLGPQARGGSSVTLHLYVTDVDQRFSQAVEAGCTPRMPPEDMFWGDRYGIVLDPYGHQWSIATHIRDASPEEIQAGANQGCPDPSAR